MRKIIILLTFLLPFFAEAQDDSTQYDWYENSYGQRYPRGWFDKVLRIPKDTIYTKWGLAQFDTSLFLGNGVKWRMVQGGGTGGGGVTDSTVRHIIDSFIGYYNSRQGTRFDGRPVITWSGEGLKYFVMFPDYWINGKFFKGFADSFTLAAAPITMARVDAVAADTLRHTVINQGDSADNPISNGIDDLSQILAGNITLNPGDTVPANVQSKFVYQNGFLPPEYDTLNASNIAGVNFQSEVSPHSIPYAIDIPPMVTHGGIYFTKSPGTQLINEFSSLTFWFRLKQPLSIIQGNGFQIRCYGENGEVLGSMVTVKPNTYGFQNITTWHKISIPTEDFGIGFQVKTIRFYFPQTNNAGYFIDDIEFQSGSSEPPVSTGPKYDRIISDSGETYATSDNSAAIIKGGARTKTRVESGVLFIDADDFVRDSINFWGEGNIILKRSPGVPPEKDTIFFTVPYTGNVDVCNSVNGKSVVTSMGGLKVFASAPRYFIGCKSYNPINDSLTFATADATHGRFDIIVVDTFNVISIIAGTPSATPIVEGVDLASQLLVATIFIPAGATVIPDIVSNIIYNERIESDTTSSMGPTNFSAIINPYDGLYSVSVKPVIAGSLMFTKPGTLLSSDYTSLSFWFRLNSTSLNPNGIQLAFYNGSSKVGSTVIVKPGQYGLTQSTTWHKVSIPMDNFGSVFTFNKIRIYSAYNNTGGFNFDKIELQNNGIIVPSVDPSFGQVQTDSLRGYSVVKNDVLKVYGEGTVRTSWRNGALRIIGSGGGSGTGRINSVQANSPLRIDSTDVLNPIVVADTAYFNPTFLATQGQVNNKADSLGAVKQNNIILTTTGTGKATFTSPNLNIPYDTTSNPSVGDTVLFYVPVPDSTLLDNYKIVYPKDKKLTNNVNFLVDPVNGSMKIGWTGTPPGGTNKIMVNGTSYLNGPLGVFTQTPSAAIHAISTTEQLRVGYSPTNYLSATVGSTGSTTFNLTGTSPTFSFPQVVITSGGIQTNATTASSNFAAVLSTGGTSTSIAQLQLAGASSTAYRALVRGSSSVAPSASNSYGSFIIGEEGVNIAASGTHPLFTQLGINPLVIAAGAGTLASSSTLYTKDASSGATNNYNIWAAGTNGSNRFDAPVVLGATFPHASAQLHVAGTGKGTLLNIGASAQMLAISLPAQGLLYWCTDSLGLCQYNGTAWQIIGRNAPRTGSYIPFAQTVGGSITQDAAFTYDSTTGVKKLRVYGLVNPANTAVKIDIGTAAGNTDITANGSSVYLTGLGAGGTVAINGGQTSAGTISLAASQVNLNHTSATITTNLGNIKDRTMLSIANTYTYSAGTQPQATVTGIWYRPTITAPGVTIVTHFVKAPGAGDFSMGTEGGRDTAHPSAIMDVMSTSRGFLIPRMTTANRNAISSPLAGLQVFDTDYGNLFLYNGAVWVLIENGGVKNVTATYSILKTDNTLTADATSASFTATLPSATVNAGKKFFIKKTDASANTVTLVGTIDGATNYVLSTQNKYVEVQSNGAAYIITANN